MFVLLKKWWKFFCWPYSWIQKREFIRGVNLIQSQFSQNTKTMGQSRKEVSWCRLLLSFVGGRRYEVLKCSAYSLMTTFLEERPILYFLIFHFSVPTWFSLESFCGLFMTTFPILSKLFSKMNTTEKQFQRSYRKSKKQRKWWLYTTCQSLLPGWAVKTSKCCITITSNPPTQKKNSLHLWMFNFGSSSLEALGKSAGFKPRADVSHDSRFDLEIKGSSFLDSFSFHRLVRCCAFVYLGNHDIALRLTEIRECNEDALKFLECSHPSSRAFCHWRWTTMIVTHLCQIWIGPTVQSWLAHLAVHQGLNRIRHCKPQQSWPQT